MAHIFQGLVHDGFGLEFILDVVQQLKFVHHVEQCVFIDVVDVQVVSLHVLYNFLVDVGLVEVGQHFLAYAHLK